MLGATPARSRIFAPDLVAGVEQDELGEKAAKELTGRVWKVFKVLIYLFPTKILTYDNDS